MLKSIIKRQLLKLTKNIHLDTSSDLNYNVINKNFKSKYSCKIVDSKCNLTNIDEGCYISESRIYGDVCLGRFASITGPGTIVKSLKEKISIGSFTSIGQNVCIVDFNHNFNRISTYFIHYNIFKENFHSDIVSSGPTVIEEDVWIGSNSIILPGVTIGRGSIIGAGTIVNIDIPAYSIVVGNPAKVIKKRFNEEQITLLEKLKWWEWDIEKIVKNKNIFKIDISKSKSQELLQIEDSIK